MIRSPDFLVKLIIFAFGNSLWRSRHKATRSLGTPDIMNLNNNNNNKEVICNLIIEKY